MEPRLARDFDLSATTSGSVVSFSAGDQTWGLMSARQALYPGSGILSPQALSHLFRIRVPQKQPGRTAQNK